MSKEQERLITDGAAWRLWGPYLSERAWGTVREDYSPDGCAWDYFPHETARSRAYRWNEDGLAGISDDKGSKDTLNGFCVTAPTSPASSPTGNCPIVTNIACWRLFAGID